MGYDTNIPPFKRGTTLSGKPASYTSLTTDFGAEIEGTVWKFPDVNPATGAKRSNRLITCIATRWLGTTPALPRQLLVLDAHKATNVGGATNTAGPLGICRASQAARTGWTLAVNPSKCYPADEYLPSAGVAVNDIFWLVIDGLAEVDSPDTQFTAIAVGSALVALTQTTAAATNGTTIAGRAAVVDVASTLGGTTSLLGSLSRVVGMALTACTSQGYRQPILCDVGAFKY